MANRTLDSGSNRDATADISVIPTVTDIGVPTGETLTTPPNNPLHPTRTRPAHFPSNSETAASLGIGVPLNPITGVKST